MRVVDGLIILHRTKVVKCNFGVSTIFVAMHRKGGEGGSTFVALASVGQATLQGDAQWAINEPRRDSGGAGYQFSRSITVPMKKGRFCSQSMSIYTKGRSRFTSR